MRPSPDSEHLLLYHALQTAKPSRPKSECLAHYISQAATVHATSVKMVTGNKDFDKEQDMAGYHDYHSKHCACDLCDSFVLIATTGQPTPPNVMEGRDDADDQKKEEGRGGGRGERGR